MISLSDLVQVPPPKKSKIASKRALLLSDIIAELNPAADKRFKAMVGFKTSHVNINDLRWLHDNCLRYAKERKGPYAKAFWGALKHKLSPTANK